MLVGGIHQYHSYLRVGRWDHRQLSCPIRVSDWWDHRQPSCPYQGLPLARPQATLFSPSGPPIGETTGNLLVSSGPPIRETTGNHLVPSGPPISLPSIFNMSLRRLAERFTEEILIHIYTIWEGDTQSNDKPWLHWEDTIHYLQMSSWLLPFDTMG